MLPFSHLPPGMLSLVPRYVRTLLIKVISQPSFQFPLPSFPKKCNNYSSFEGLIECFNDDPTKNSHFSPLMFLPKCQNPII
ncbi:Uncharacterized protein TCM_001570 [Theobroma cacao]|uniref:Uncharacterized protein n=1 Tax=Theobroma cacao TaxID=3641 RepID=A0A061DJ71_THECC|nr:Uncharacterized protein TCM_001570 [Theobroma cacao]